jgi:SAM-dependent methyltransferase
MIGYAELIHAMPLLAPNSSGAAETIARLTILSANQVFPLLSELLTRIGGRALAELVAADALCAQAGGEAEAARLKQHLDAHGSDKATGSDQASGHRYHAVYGARLARPPAVTAVLEIGIGTNNEDIASNMGREGHPGASLRAFRDALPGARIYGADIDPRILFHEERIETFFVDQTRLDSFEELGRAIVGELDLVIDDGLHAPNANLATLLFALPRLRQGGWLVVEDIKPIATPFWQVVAAALPERYLPRIVSSGNDILFVVERLT